MKCPKCAYTSFDYLDNCRKCGTELREVRTLLQILAISPEQRVPNPGLGAGPEAAVHAAAEESPDIYAFSAPATSFDADELGADQPFQAVAAEEGEEEFLADLSFDDSFASIVEPTSYRETPATAAPEVLPAEEDEALDLDLPGISPASKELPVEEDELLDLDFADVFGESKEETAG